MPFPISHRGTIEAWIGDDGDNSNYHNLFVTTLSDELRGMGRKDVYVLEQKGALDRASPQLYFPEGSVVTFGNAESQPYFFDNRRGLLGREYINAMASGELEIESKDGILTISYYISQKLSVALFSVALSALFGIWIAFNRTQISNWTFFGFVVASWLFLLVPNYLNDLMMIRKLIKRVVIRVREQIALDSSKSSSVL